MRERVRELSQRYSGFKEREPCWVSSEVWPQVAEMYGDECLRPVFDGRDGGGLKGEVELGGGAWFNQ